MTNELVTVDEQKIREALDRLKDFEALYPLIEEADELVATYRMVGPIVDVHTREQAGLLFVRASAFKKKVAELCAPIKDIYFKLHKSACDGEKALTEPATRFIEAIDRGMRTWDNECERQRLEREALLKEQLRKKEEEERLAEAVELEQQGWQAEAERLVSAPIPDPVVVVASEKPKVAGMANTKGWDFTIDDPDKVPRSYMEVSESKIRRVVNTMGNKAEIPGVTVFPKSGYKATGRRSR